MEDLLANKPKIFHMSPRSIFQRRFEELSLALYKQELSETNVLHFLVLARKLDEAIRKDQSSMSPNLNQRVKEREDNKETDYIKLFCDWGVHSELNGSPIGQSTLYDMNIMLATKDISNDIFMQNFYRVLQFSSLRSQLADLFMITPSHRPPTVIRDRSQWQNFCYKLLGLVEGVKLNLDESKLGKLKKDLKAKNVRYNEEKIVRSLCVERDFGNEQCYVLKAFLMNDAVLCHYINIVENGEIKLSQYVEWR